MSSAQNMCTRVILQIILNFGEKEERRSTDLLQSSVRNFECNISIMHQIKMSKIIREEYSRPQQLYDYNLFCEGMLPTVCQCLRLLVSIWASKKVNKKDENKFEYYAVQKSEISTLTDKFVFLIISFIFHGRDNLNLTKLRFV